LILVDNGNGTKQDAKFWSHYHLHGDDTLEKSLGKYGFSKDDMTDVFLTHLHFDHCGGSITIENGKLVPNFKNATYWSNAEHWKWATEPNEREKASFLKENRLKFIDIAKGNESKLGETRFSDNITFRFVNGHTQAMMLPQTRYNGKTVVFMADLLPSAGHIPLPYVMGYDMFPLTTLNEKKAFLKEALDNDYILFFEHDPKYECCTLQQTDRGIRPKEYFKLEEI
jgi:glyoxylase-like metal-dependent hydrolase (beta-lactamase superfamily II)